MIGSNIFITNRFNYGTKVSKLIRDFKARVAAEGGTFEAESCLKATLETLDLQYLPLVVEAPVISGDNYAGSTLSTTNGVFDGITPFIYTYQWLLDGNPILGATSNTYVVANNGTLSCKVTATNSFGNASSISNEIVPDNRLIFSVKTDNAGTSASNQFTIPTTGIGYLYDIETSDGQTITGLTGNTTITFPSAGTYDVYISGSFPQFYFNFTGDRLKLLDLKNFGIYALGYANQAGAFRGCENMIISATDIGHFENVTNFTRCFQACRSITSLPLISTSNTTTFNAAFEGCSGLIEFPNLDFSSSNDFRFFINGGTSLTTFPANMFDNSTASNYFYAFTSTNLSTQSIDDILVSLDTSGVSNGTFLQSGGGNTPSATGLTAKANLISKGWTVTTN
jgi:hypothetical protein